MLSRLLKLCIQSLIECSAQNIVKYKIRENKRARFINLDRKNEGTMATRKGGMRRKTRSKLRKNVSDRGKISIKKYFQEFKIGDPVCLAAEPAVQGGMYFPRFHGRHGKVAGKQGHCYKVNIKDGNKEKMVVAHPIHLKKAK